MIQVVPFKPQHLVEINLQEAQRVSESNVHMYRDIIPAMGPSRTGIEDGKVVYCAGILDTGAIRVVWTMLSDCGPGKFRVVHKQIRELIDDFIDSRGFHSFVRDDHEAGHRWMKLLGFSDTGELRDCDGELHRRYYLCLTQ